MKLLTRAELKKLDMCPMDRDLVEKIVGDLMSRGQDPDNPECQAIRGFLVQQFEENIVTPELREELPGDAASFSEGWQAAIEYLKSIGEPVGPSHGMSEYPEGTRVIIADEKGVKA